MTPTRIAVGTVLALAAVLPYLGILPGWTPALATVAGLMALSLIGLNLIFGVTGMLALGQAAFVALPGYVSGILQAHNVPGALAIPIGIGATVGIARLVAEIFVRLPGIYFAIGTLGFALVVEGLARAFPSITGGASGLVLEPPVLLGQDAWYALTVASLALGLLAYRRLVRGRFLRTLRLVRHDELAAEVLGVSVPRLKARVFTIGSAYSACGGILLAYYVQVLAPESGGVNASLEALAKTIIGGAGFLFGPLLGAAALQWLFEVSGGADRYELLVYGLSFFLVVLFAPAGIAGALRSIRSAVGAGLELRRPKAPPQPVPFRTEIDSDRHAPQAERSQERAKPCLHVEEATVYFGGLCAVDHVSLDVSFGEIVAIIGPNGAGKTTLFNVISGIEQPSEGRLRLENADLNKMPIHRRAAVIGRSFQVPRLVPELTALENVMARLDHLPAHGPVDARRRIAAAQLAAFGLDDLSGRFVREIGLGYHKLIELARASVGQPPLLLLDEPAVGLTTDELDRLAESLQRLKRQNAAILIVEHNVDFVAAIADQVVVMESGRVIARGSPATVIADPSVQAAYLGSLP